MGWGGIIGGVLGGAAGSIIPGVGTGIGAAIGAGIGGGMDANSQNAEINSTNNSFNADQSAQNREFQERMSNTAYQRASADMKAAGLNPMLAYQQGGASQPSGSAASAASPIRMDDYTSRAVSSGVDAWNLKNQIRSVNADVALKEANTITAKSEALKTANDARTAKANADVAESYIETRKKQAEAEGRKATWDSYAADYDALMSRISREAGAAASAGSLFKLFGGGKPSSTGLPSGARNIKLP